MTKKLEVIIGERIGKRTVIEDLGTATNGATMVKVKCDCGYVCNRRLSVLKSGFSQQCYRCNVNKWKPAMRKIAEQAIEKLTTQVSKKAGQLEKHTSKLNEIERHESLIEQIEAKIEIEKFAASSNMQNALVSQIDSKKFVALQPLEELGNTQLVKDMDELREL
jgi:hypothetical protein